jgi:predicted ATPase
MEMLKRVVISGFKSIKSMDLELKPLNVLIGANGAGKSNFVSFFKMLNEMMGGRLQQYVATSGRAHSLLHYGPKVSTRVETRLEFDVEDGLATYELALFNTAGDALMFADEIVAWKQVSVAGPATVVPIGGGHQETRIGAEAERGNRSAKSVRHFLNSCRVYHFHDTSSTARVQQFSYIGDNRSLLADGGNLAAFLFRLQLKDQGFAYRRIVSMVRMIAPYFDDFELRPEGPNAQEIILKWREKGSDEVFGPHQLSDGTLRTIFLVALLLQPEAELPSLIIVDEPELGLHPYAVNVIASLIKKASHHAQVIVSTQSSSFLDNFEPCDVIVVDREETGSVFTRVDSASLETWLEEYSLGEVWEKNVIGGGPH